MNTTNNNPTVKMSKGFTMIELIFVIVIIGILAAVAIPKLSATRDDAKVATCMDGATSFMSQATAYYTSQGKLGKISEMTNLATDADADNKSNGFSADDALTANGNTATYWCDGGAVVTYTIEANATGFAITPRDASTNAETEKVAKQTALALDAKKYFRTYQLGGNTVKY